MNILSFHIDILRIRSTDPLDPEEDDLSWVEIRYRIQDCVDKGWLVDKGEEGWVWVRETIMAPEVPAKAMYEFDGASWPDRRFGQQIFKPGELKLVDGKLCYPIGNGLGLR